ncbi:MAG: hypothetical protein J6A05_10740 [Oscillospiraceae bacterium]|nr:hypothetical protein [Oscillospiraceae bacterium]
MISTIAKLIGGLHFSYIPLGNEDMSILIASALMIGIVASLFCKNIKSSIAVIVTMFMFVVSFANIQRYIGNDTITIAVLKNNASVSAIVHDNKSACVIDLKKGGKTAEYAVKYLNRNGIRKINSIVMNVDAVSSQVIYDKQFNIFEIETYMIPEVDRKYVDTKNENIYFYTDRSRIDTSDYNIEFKDDIVVTDVKGTELLFCTSESDISDYNNCEVTILYSGKKFASSPASGSIVIMSEKPENQFLPEANYINESVGFEFNKYGEMKTKLIR